MADGAQVPALDEEPPADLEPAVAAEEIAPEEAAAVVAPEQVAAEEVAAQDAVVAPATITVTISQWPGANQAVQVSSNDARLILLQVHKRYAFKLFFIRRQFFPPNVPGGLTIPTVVVDSIHFNSIEILVPVAFQHATFSKKRLTADARDTFQPRDLTIYRSEQDIRQIFDPNNPITSLVRYNRADIVRSGRRKGQVRRAVYFDVLDRDFPEPRFGPFYAAEANERPQLEQFVNNMRQNILRARRIAPPNVGDRR